MSLRSVSSCKPIHLSSIRLLASHNILKTHLRVSQKESGAGLLASRLLFTLCLGCDDRRREDHSRLASSVIRKSVHEFGSVVPVYISDLDRLEYRLGSEKNTFIRTTSVERVGSDDMREEWKLYD